MFSEKPQEFSKLAAGVIKIYTTLLYINVTFRRGLVFVPGQTDMKSAQFQSILSPPLIFTFIINTFSMQLQKVFTEF